MHLVVVLRIELEDSAGAAPEGRVEGREKTMNAGLWMIDLFIGVAKPLEDRDTGYERIEALNGLKQMIYMATVYMLKDVPNRAIKRSGPERHSLSDVLKE